MVQKSFSRFIMEFSLSVPFFKISWTDAERFRFLTGLHQIWDDHSLSLRNITFPPPYFNIVCNFHADGCNLCPQWKFITSVPAGYTSESFFFSWQNTKSTTCTFHVQHKSVYTSHHLQKYTQNCVFSLQPPK